jgi:hypothetical protein
MVKAKLTYFTGFGSQDSGLHSCVHLSDNRERWQEVSPPILLDNNRNYNRMSSPSSTSGVSSSSQSQLSYNRLHGNNSPIIGLIKGKPNVEDHKGVEQPVYYSKALISEWHQPIILASANNSNRERPE